MQSVRYNRLFGVSLLTFFVICTQISRRFLLFIYHMQVPLKLHRYILLPWVMKLGQNDKLLFRKSTYGQVFLGDQTYLCFTLLKLDKCTHPNRSCSKLVQCNLLYWNIKTYCPFNISWKDVFCLALYFK